MHCEHNRGVTIHQYEPEISFTVKDMTSLIRRPLWLI